MDNIKVSIGIPVFNGEKWLKDTLDSILSQTYSHLEVIISDNASTDNTESLGREYSTKDNRVKYYRNVKNIGVANNYNMAFKYSTGDYFKWSAASDIIKPEFIEKCLNSFTTDSGLVLVCPGTVLFNDEIGSKEKYKDNLDVSSDKPVERFIHFLENVKLNNLMNGLIKSAVLRKTGLIKNFRAADVNMVAELSLYGKFKCLPEYLFFRRMEEETATFYKSHDEILKYFNPSNKKLMLFQYWKMDLYYLSVVKNSSLTPAEKKTLFLYVLNMLYWHKKTLWKDFLYSLKSFPSAQYRRWSSL